MVENSKVKLKGRESKSVYQFNAIQAIQQQKVRKPSKNKVEKARTIDMKEGLKT